MVPLAELGECIETGAPTAPDMSRGSHVVPGLRLWLWRFPWGIVVNAVEGEIDCEGAVVAMVEYG
jgi:hypothetical protein